MKSRNGSHEDHDVERELAAIDAALAGTAVEPELAELAELAVALRADRPRPSSGFAAELDARLRAGFPPAEQTTEPDVHAPSATGRARRLLGRLGMPEGRRALPLAVGSAASLFLVVTAVISSGVLSSDGGGTRVEGGREPAPAGGTTLERADGVRRSAPGASGEASPSTPESLPPIAPRPPGGIAPRVRDRKVKRDASLALAAPTGEIEQVADGVIGVTDRYRGFVLGSAVSGGEDGRAGATFDLRIPSDNLQRALRDLSELAHVRSRTQTTEDVTGRFVSAESRLEDALTERRTLLRQLARAVTPNETASIRARLRLANRRIEAARASLRSLRNRVELSAVAVAIEPDDSLAGDDGGWTLGEAFDDALRVLGALAGAALVALAVLVPVAVLGMLAWLASRRIVRERRERALDRPA